LFYYFLAVRKYTMPFESKSQQKWMFANHPQMAKEWVKETDFSNLPEKKKKPAKKKTVKEAQGDKRLATIRAWAKENAPCTWKSAGEDIQRLAAKYRTERLKKEAATWKSVGEDIKRLIANGPAGKTAFFQGAGSALPHLVKGTLKSVGKPAPNRLTAMSLNPPRNTVPPVVPPAAAASSGQPAQKPLSLWESFQKGYRDHRQRVVSAHSPAPEVSNSQPFVKPKQISDANNAAFQRGEWTPDSYTVSGRFGMTPQTAGNKPLPEETVRSVYDTAQELFPVKGNAAGKFVRQARPVAVESTEKGFAKGVNGVYFPRESKVEIALGKPGVFGHERGHTVQAPESSDLLGQRGGYFKWHNAADKKGSPLATLGFEDEANDISYKIFRRLFEKNPSEANRRAATDAFWRALTSAEYKYLPEAMKEIGGKFVGKQNRRDLAELLGDKFHQLLTNTNTSGFDRSLPAWAQWYRTGVSPVSSFAYLTARNINKGLLKSRAESPWQIAKENPGKIVKMTPSALWQAAKENPGIAGLAAAEISSPVTVPAAGYSAYRLSDYLLSDIWPIEGQD
jgi:hypothetical protein